jgi:protease PrsW
MIAIIIVFIFVAMNIGLVTLMLRGDKGEKEPIGALWIAAGFGFLGVILAILLETKLIPLNDLKSTAPVGAMFFSSMGVGMIEEACKFLPLAIFIYHKRYFNEHTDGIIYFAIAGLAFGLPENILYTVQFGTSAGFTRLILTPFFHAAVTGMVGYYLIKIKLAGKSPFNIIPFLLLAMLLHGLYDFGLTDGQVGFVLLSFVITIGVSINLINLYTRANDLDKQQGLSAVGHNRFCRNCGYKNPENLLYCTKCGKRA